MGGEEKKLMNSAWVGQRSRMKKQQVLIYGGTKQTGVGWGMAQVVERPSQKCWALIQTPVPEEKKKKKESVVLTHLYLYSKARSLG
jgi:hypothetical protein